MKHRQHVSSTHHAAVSHGSRLSPLRVGFLRENDCAPVVVAQEFGWFEHFGLSVQLQPEPSWRQIHQKLQLGLLEAAHAPASLPFLMNLGLTPEKVPCVAGLVLSVEGNAITISHRLAAQGVTDAATLGDHVRKHGHCRQYTFGVGLAFSPQHFLLHRWLEASGLPPGAVRITPAPNEQLFPLLKLGYLDGFCAGEPWGTVAVQARVGKCVAVSSQIAPLHPEKVLMVRQDFAERRATEHELLIAALIHACSACDQPEFRAEMCDLLAQPCYVNAPVDCLVPGLVGPFTTDDHQLHALHGLNTFSRARANEPSAAKADWIRSRLFDIFHWTRRPAELNGAFRPDIYRRARRLVSATLKSGPNVPGNKPQPSSREGLRPSRIVTGLAAS